LGPMWEALGTVMQLQPAWTVAHTEEMQLRGR
jgi:hypothetical protein